MKTVSKRLERPEASLSERLETLVARYRPFIRDVVARLCPRYLGSERSEIEQNVIIRFWRTVERETEVRNFESYLYRVVATVTLDTVREVKARREEQLISEEAAEVTSSPAMPGSAARSPEQTTLQRELIERVEKIINELSAERARVVKLHLQGFTPEEVASMLGWSEPKARNTIYRALAELRERLRELKIDVDV